MHILFVCDFNSVHSRNLISSISEYSNLKITVLSTYKSTEMNGVDLICMNDYEYGNKGKLDYIANFIFNNLPSIYNVITTYFLFREIKKLVSNIDKLNIPIDIDLIHALRTQPEGIVANYVAKRFNKKYCLTTWGQDFTLWSKLLVGFTNETKKAVLNSTFIFPDNYRDADIVNNFGFNKDNIMVLPATGGLESEYLSQIELPNVSIESNKNNFLCVRGYQNNYVNLKKVIETFVAFKEIHSDSHLYIDLHQRVNIKKEDYLNRLIHKYNCKESITLLHLSREEMFSYMKACQYHVSVTYSDGMPMSLLESLYFGQIPIVYNHKSTAILESKFKHFYTFTNYSNSVILKAWLFAFKMSTIDQSKLRIINRDILRKNYYRNTNINRIIQTYKGLVTPQLSSQKIS